MKKKFTNLFNLGVDLPVKPEYDRFKKNVNKASDISPDSTTRGKRFLDPADRWFRKVDTMVDRFIPKEYNPFTQSGAVANVSFVIALVTGFLLLIWYRPSAFLAYEITEAMGNQRYFAGMIRSLHRYSSDVCMLFILYHGFKVFFGARFTGSRTLAWITGIVGAWLIWFDGWLGYWLVWDQRGALVAQGTAKFMDVLPVFAEPLAASFLTNDSFSSLLFFIVFFLHMLIPLAFAVALWLHVTRLNKPRFFTSWNFAALITLSLVALSIIVPADIEAEADMLNPPAEMTGDWFYLLPLYVTERLHGGMLWLISIISFVALASVPWVFRRRKKKTIPQIKEKTCNGCIQCFHDCPYNAISMVPRRIGSMKKSEEVALIDPDICVSCGICVGSCDPVAIEYPGLSPWEIRQNIDDFLEAKDMEGRHVAFTCGNCAGDGLNIDPETGDCVELPGYIVFAVPCAGWIHPSLIERAMKNGAGGVVVLGCQSDPDFRLGSDWIEDRVEGVRHPQLRRDKLKKGDLLMLKMDPSRMNEFIEEAIRFSQRSEDIEENGTVKNPALWKQFTIGLMLIVGISALTTWLSIAPIPMPERDTEILIHFKMKGSPIQTHEDERLDLPAHMQRQDTEVVDRRSDVRLQVVKNNVVIYDEQYRPSGIRRRGYSNAIISVPVSAGSNEIQLRLGDAVSESPGWRFSDSRILEIPQGKRAVVRFDENHGFRWYLPHSN